MKLTKGDKAPGFVLRDTETKEINLEQFRGKNVLLLFFPLAFTGTCTTELCQMRDDKSFYDGVNAEIIAVSVDSLFSLGKYKEQESYNFPLLSDFNKDVSRSYGALYDDFVLGMKGVAKRSAFVIDKNGIIQYAEVLEIATDLPNFTEINTVLEKLT